MKKATKKASKKGTTKAKPKGEVKAKATKPASEGTAKPKAPKTDKAVSCLDAAAIVLKDSGGSMACRAMIDAMREKKLWASDAPTPHATLASALLREITKKGDASRFKKV